MTDKSDNMMGSLAMASWVSVFALSWLLILGRVNGMLPFGFLIFFFVIALFTSAVATPRRSA